MYYIMCYIRHRNRVISDQRPSAHVLKPASEREGDREREGERVRSFESVGEDFMSL